MKDFIRNIFLRGFLGALGCIALPMSVAGQQATELLDAATVKYNEATSYEAAEDFRVIFAALGEGVKGDLPNYSVPRGIVYVSHRLKTRRPNHVWFARRSWSTGAAATGDMNDPGTWSYIALAGSSVGTRSYQRGSWLSGSLTDREVWNSLRQSFGTAEERIVLRYFVNSGSAAKPPELGVAEARLIGTEPVKGRLAYKIEGKTVRTRKPVWVWVDKETGFVTRTIVVSFTGTPKGSEAYIYEAFYTNQRSGVALGTDDFSVAKTLDEKTDDPKKFGFGPVDDVMREARIAELAKATREAAPETAVTRPVSPTEDTKTAPAEVDAQILTEEQMQGIVLVEGEEGNTASGFMTKIRDVDFVVTNLHVLAQGGKFKITNLRGEEIPVRGIFGAVGSDIAIMRIDKVEGSLKLAADVFKSVKIGDRIVVVGNRLGGGVATQTIGQAVGVGPMRVEVNANFQPGNSGSPIVSVANGEVVGVATYTATQRADAQPSSRVAGRRTVMEKRWFGYRLDSIQKWEPIDLAKWKVQATRIRDFYETSYAIEGILWGSFGPAKDNRVLRDIVTRYENKTARMARTSSVAVTETRDMLRAVRAAAEAELKKFSEEEYYDYFKTCRYWDHSVTLHTEYRTMLIRGLKRGEDGVVDYLSNSRREM